MARVTVEDCIDKIPNRFELVMIASQRARDIASGVSLTVERDNDKNPVVSLREIANEAVDLDQLQNSQIQGLQHHVEFDEPEEEEEDVMELLRSEQQIGGVDLEQASGVTEVSDVPDVPEVPEVPEAAEEGLSGVGTGEEEEESAEVSSLDAPQESTGEGPTRVSIE